MLAASASRLPNQPAIVSLAETTTYRQLLHTVDAFAARLEEQQLQAGDPIVVILPNGPEFAVAVFACAKLGCIAIPLNPSFQETELEHYLNNSAAETVITSATIAAKHRHTIRAINSRCRIIVDPLKNENTVASGDSASDHFTGDFLFQYSSGTTGEPKKIVRKQSALAQEASQYAQTLNLSQDDRVLAVVPMSHSYGFGNCLMAAICAGATLYTLENFNRRRVMDTLIEKRITVFPGVPFMFSVLAESPSLGEMHFPDLRLVYSAGAPLDRNTFEAFQDKFHVPVRQHYGSTETGPAAINLESTEGDLWASVGKSVNNVTIKIIRYDGQPAAIGEIGDVVIYSTTTAEAQGIPTEPAQQRAADGGFFTGDLGRLDAEGNLFVTGRESLFINVGGNKVNPSEVESILQKHTGVSESLVVGTESAHGQEFVKAIVVCEAGLTEDDLKAWCKGKIADFKIPRIIEFRDKLPRTALGKVQRSAVQEPPAG